MTRMENYVAAGTHPIFGKEEFHKEISGILGHFVKGPLCQGFEILDLLGRFPRVPLISPWDSSFCMWILEMGVSRKQQDLTIRHPTDAEYAAYDGTHCCWVWRATPESWRCPGCNRSKRGILIWGTRKGHNAIKYDPIGWKAALNKFITITAPIMVWTSTENTGDSPLKFFAAPATQSTVTSKRSWGSPKGFHLVPRRSVASSAQPITRRIKSCGQS
jgi:hypothetical protein